MPSDAAADGDDMDHRKIRPSPADTGEEALDDDSDDPSKRKPYSLLLLLLSLLPVLVAASADFHSSLCFS